MATTQHDLFNQPAGAISGLRWSIGERQAAPAGERMSSPDAVVRYMQWQATRDREIMTALLVDAKNQIIDHVTVSVGDSASASVYPVEVFRPAIIARASSIILVHNHPPGDCTPSACDVDLTRQLATVGRALGITILDHIIIGPGFSRYSFSENGMTELWP